MARMRSIKPGFFTNEDLAECSPHARLLFAGLWIIADRQGRLEDRPKRIKVEVFPYEDVDVDALLTELATRETVDGVPFVVRYSVNGHRYISMPAWKKHQSPHINERQSIIPEHTEYDTSTVQAQYKDDVATVQAPYEHSSSTPITVTDTGTDTDTGIQSSVSDSDTAREPLPVDKSLPVESSPPDCSQANEDKSTPTPPPARPKGSPRFHPEPCGDGELCNCLRVNGVMRQFKAINPQHFGQIHNPHTDLGARMVDVTEAICAKLQDKLPTLTPKQRAKSCQRALVDFADRLAESFKETPDVLPRYIVGIIKRDDVITDRLLEELRREASAAYGASKAEALAGAAT